MSCSCAFSLPTSPCCPSLRADSPFSADSSPSLDGPDAELAAARSRLFLLESLCLGGGGGGGTVDNRLLGAHASTLATDRGRFPARIDGVRAGGGAGGGDSVEFEFNCSGSAEKFPDDDVADTFLIEPGLRIGGGGGALG